MSRTLIGRERDRIQIEPTTRVESCEAVLEVSDFKAKYSGQTAIGRQMGVRLMSVAKSITSGSRLSGASGAPMARNDKDCIIPYWPCVGPALILVI
jgi:hypothetical protein